MIPLFAILFTWAIFGPVLVSILTEDVSSFDLRSPQPSNRWYYVLLSGPIVWLFLLIDDLIS